jgi:predicted ATPase/DNA-binding winged helix-turn-helix (wHTH) protein
LSAHGHNLIYESGQWQVHVGRRELLASGVAVPIGSRAFEIIEVLVRSANELVTKNDLMDRIWPGAVVGENTLQVHISAIRKAFGPDRTMLKTASGRGYRLLGNWTTRQQGAASQPVASSPTREPSAAPANNFPAIAGRLIGRAEAARHVRDLISAYRVVTLTGPGGIGKTSLAIEAARGLLADFGGGGWFVELASLSNPDLVPSTVASALGLKLSGEISADSVARAVGAKHLLLVLDNCEHVIDAAVNLVERVVRLCPHTTTLVTSREVPRIDGEVVYRVPPLDVPALDQEMPDHVLGYSAVELFITRMNALDTDFSPRAEELTSVTAICRRLDGIPLAIEFAAASAATFGIASVATGLRDRFALLTGGRRTALARQRTLRATLDWSHELLPEAEQRLFRRLAVFPGGFTLDAAIAVMTDSGLDAAMVTDGVANLVMKSLVALDTTRRPTRWYLLETIRAYALEKLVNHDEADTAAGYHARYFRDLVTPLMSGTRSSLSNEELTHCVREIDNVRAALDWCFSASGDPEIGVDLTAAYAPVWIHLLLTNECRERCERALLSPDPHVTGNMRPRMQLRIALADVLTTNMGSASRAITVLTQALEIAETLDDVNAQAWALRNLWTVFIFRDEYASARTVIERVGKIADRIDDPASARVVYRLMGNVLFTSGKPREAQRIYERALWSPVASGDRHGTIDHNSGDHAAARAMLARTLWIQGFTERALDEARLSLEVVRGTDHSRVLCLALYYGICRIAPTIGDFVTAEREIERLIDAATRSNARFWEIGATSGKGSCWSNAASSRKA